MHGLEDKLRDFLDNNGIDYKDNHNSFILTCPDCNTPKKLYINKDEGFYTCFRCAENGVKGGGPFKILSELTGMHWKEVKARFSEFVTDEILLGENPEKTTVRSAPLYGDVVIDTKDHFKINLDISKPGLAYMQSRGVPKELCQKLNIKYNPRTKSVVFPVYKNRELVGYQERSVDPNCPKQYAKKTLKGFEKKFYLMFEDTIDTQSVILCEGPVDAIKFDKTGCGYVATMGKSVSDSQMNRLKELGIQKVYLALDTNAYKETESLIRKYAGDFELFTLSVPNHREDFGACTFEECVLAFKQAEVANLMTILPDF